MHRWTAVPLLLIVCLLGSRPAGAGTAPRDFKSALKAMASSITVPPEWDGVWTTVDSMYDCTGALTGTSAGEDTICGGQVVTAPPDPDNPFTFSCTGSANGNTIDVICTGSGEIIPDCVATFEMHIQSTRTADFYRSVTTWNQTYSGDGKGCDFFPDGCSRTVSEGTRQGPAPIAYCTTPARRSTWGRLKTIYR